MPTARDDVEAAPRGREEVVNAILDAAYRLFSERSPSTVSLREIAAAAGVNYGLVHRHFRTKEALFTAVLARRSHSTREIVLAADDAYTALRALSGSRVYTQLLALAVLDGVDLAALVESPTAIEALVGRLTSEKIVIHDQGDEPPLDPRAVVAAFGAMRLGWQLFGPYLRRLVGWDDDVDADTGSSARIEPELERISEILIQHM